MQDYESSDERIARAMNIAANGRWLVILMVAISIAVHEFRFAFVFAAVLGASAIIEQLPKRWRSIGAAMIYVFTMGIMIAMAAFRL